MQTNNLNVYLKQNVLGSSFKKLIVKLLFPFRNHFILFNITAKAKNNRVNLNYWWEKPNLGDELSRVIVEYMLSLHNISCDKIVKGKKHLYAVGSVITAGIQDCTIWGSGILSAGMLYRIRGRKLDVRSVRGPVTRILLIDMGYIVPEIFGDPVIILPEIYQPAKTEKKYKYGVVTHKDHILLSESDKLFLNRDDVLMIDIRTRDYKGFVDKISSCDLIVSSSLHGIIISESYGVPAILLKPTSEPMLKYCDWYYSTNRLQFPVIDSLVDALSAKTIDVPDLQELRESQKKAFPYDLYDN